MSSCISELNEIYSALKKKKNLKNLTYYLILNVGFMFIEVIYGLISNSLGLLTDGAHMLLDSTAVLIGLYTSYLSGCKSDSNYNFGYNRSEIMGTFINSVFLFFIAIYIIFESIERFISPKTIHSENLILVSFLGLLVNLVGVYYLHDQHDDSHEHHHHHHHEETSEIKEQDKKGCEEHAHNHNEYNENLYTIYIHILADTLGSVAVLVSAFLIKYYSLYISDPICSLFISVMIFYSTLPVLKNATMTLLHIPNAKILKKKEKIEKAIKGIQCGNDVKLSIGKFDLWQMKKDYIVAEMKISLHKNEEGNIYDGLGEIESKIATIFKNNKINEHYFEII